MPQISSCARQLKKAREIQAKKLEAKKNDKKRKILQEVQLRQSGSDIASKLFKQIIC